MCPNADTLPSQTPPKLFTVLFPVSCIQPRTPPRRATFHLYILYSLACAVAQVMCVAYMYEKFEPEAQSGRTFAEIGPNKIKPQDVFSAPPACEVV